MSVRSSGSVRRGAVLVRGHGGLPGSARSSDSEGPRILTTRREVVIAVGSSAAVPPIAGLAKHRYLNNREATVAKAVSGRGIDLGGDVEDEADHGLATGVIVTDPEVGMLGLTEAQARDVGFEMRAVGARLEP